MPTEKSMMMLPGCVRLRADPGTITTFDSTGLAIQDPAGNLKQRNPVR
jgi:hypothetical protein